MIQIKDGQVIPFLNSRNAPTLEFQTEYKKKFCIRILTIKIRQIINKLHFIKQKLDAAKWYIDAINQHKIH